MARVVMLAVGRLGVEKVEPRYVINVDGSIFVLDDVGYLKGWRPAYPDCIEFKELHYDRWEQAPGCVIYFLSCCLGNFNFGMNADNDRRKEFAELWECVTKTKEEKKTMKIKNPSCKALMLFGRKDSHDTYDINGYDAAVFVWNSVDGVRRMNFGEYLDLLSDKHDATYALHKIQRKDCPGIVQDDFDKFVAYCCATNTNYKDLRAQMWFRSLWYAATEEVMDV